MDSVCCVQSYGLGAIRALYKCALPSPSGGMGGCIFLGLAIGEAVGCAMTGEREQRCCVASRGTL